MKQTEIRPLLVRESLKVASNQVSEITKTLSQQAFSYQKRHSVQAKILSKHKAYLADIWKVFYLDCNRQQNDCFLLNDYQRKAPNKIEKKQEVKKKIARFTR